MSIEFLQYDYAILLLFW